MGTVFTLADVGADAGFWAVRLTDVLMVVAVLLAPMVAVRIQRKLDHEREQRQEKRRLFATLMATRAPAARTSAMHVENLNRIDIVFGGNKQTPADRAVTEAWRVYLDALDYSSTDERERIARVLASDDKFVDLLYHMGHAVGYHFDRPHLAKGVYSPEAHAAAERRALEVHERVSRVLTGEQPIAVKVEQPQPAGLDGTSPKEPARRQR